MLFLLGLLLAQASPLAVLEYGPAEPVTAPYEAELTKIVARRLLGADDRIFKLRSGVHDRRVSELEQELDVTQQLLLRLHGFDHAAEREWRRYHRVQRNDPLRAIWKPRRVRRAEDRAYEWVRKHVFPGSESLPLTSTLAKNEELVPPPLWTFGPGAWSKEMLMLAHAAGGSKADYRKAKAALPANSLFRKLKHNAVLSDLAGKFNLPSLIALALAKRWHETIPRFVALPETVELFPAVRVAANSPQLLRGGRLTLPADGHFDLAEKLAKYWREVSRAGAFSEYDIDFVARSKLSIKDLGRLPKQSVGGSPVPSANCVGRVQSYPSKAKLVLCDPYDAPHLYNGDLGINVPLDGQNQSNVKTGPRASRFLRKVDLDVGRIKVQSTRDYFYIETLYVLGRTTEVWLRKPNLLLAQGPKGNLTKYSWNRYYDIVLPKASKYRAVVVQHPTSWLAYKPLSAPRSLASEPNIELSSRMESHVRMVAALMKVELPRRIRSAGDVEGFTGAYREFEAKVERLWAQKGAMWSARNQLVLQLLRLLQRQQKELSELEVIGIAQGCQFFHGAVRTAGQRVVDDEVLGWSTKCGSYRLSLPYLPEHSALVRGTVVRVSIEGKEVLGTIIGVEAKPAPRLLVDLRAPSSDSKEFGSLRIGRAPTAVVRGMVGGP